MVNDVAVSSLSFLSFVGIFCDDAGLESLHDEGKNLQGMEI